jgi:hypothetical protein
MDGEPPSQEEATMGNGQRPKDKPKDPRREQLRQER